MVGAGLRQLHLALKKSRAAEQGGLTSSGTASLERLAAHLHPDCFVFLHEVGALTKLTRLTVVRRGERWLPAFPHGHGRQRFSSVA